MSESLKVILHSKKYDDGTQPVMLQCIITRQSGNVWKRRTICRVKPEQFDKGTGRVKNHPNKVLLNTKISDAFSEAEKRLLTLQLQGKPIDAEVVISSAPSTISLRPMLLAYGDKYAKRCELKGQVHTADKYTSHLNTIRRYLAKDQAGNQIDIDMALVDEDWLLNFASWSRANGSKSDNTLHRRMAFMRTLFNDARKRKVIATDPTEFLQFKEQAVRKVKLTAGQIVQLEACELLGRQADARNTFMLQFYAYGTRISDALNWKKSDIVRTPEGMHLQYTSIKTGKLITVRLHPSAVAIVEQYLLSVQGPYLLPWLVGFTDQVDLQPQENLRRLIKQISSKTCIINSQLAAISQTLGFDVPITTHIARHSFATLADQTIADKRKISAALGHSTFATTEVYLSELRQSDVNDSMNQVWAELTLSGSKQ